MTHFFSPSLSLLICGIHNKLVWLGERDREGKEIECGTVRYCDDMTRLGAQLLSRALQVRVLNVLNPEDSERLLQVGSLTHLILLS